MGHLKRYVCFIATSLIFCLRYSECVKFKLNKSGSLNGSTKNKVLTCDAKAKLPISPAHTFTEGIEWHIHRSIKSLFDITYGSGEYQSSFPCYYVLSSSFLQRLYIQTRVAIQNSTLDKATIDSEASIYIGRIIDIQPHHGGQVWQFLYAGQGTEHLLSGIHIQCRRRTGFARLTSLRKHIKENMPGKLYIYAKSSKVIVNWDATPEDGTPLMYEFIIFDPLNDIPWMFDKKMSIRAATWVGRIQYRTLSGSFEGNNPQKLSFSFEQAAPNKRTSSLMIMDLKMKDSLQYMHARQVLYYLELWEMLVLTEMPPWRDGIFKKLKSCFNCFLSFKSNPDEKVIRKQHKEALKHLTNKKQILINLKVEKPDACFRIANVRERGYQNNVDNMLAQLQLITPDPGKVLSDPKHIAELVKRLASKSSFDLPFQRPINARLSACSTGVYRRSFSGTSLLKSGGNLLRSVPTTIQDVSIMIAHLLIGIQAYLKQIGRLSLRHPLDAFLPSVPEMKELSKQYLSAKDNSGFEFEKFRIVAVSHPAKLQTEVTFQSNSFECFVALKVPAEEYQYDERESLTYLKLGMKKLH